jgi:glycosyltransferase involved in cell wall biosynthesis
MDGLEWKRSKYSRPVQRFLQYAEMLGVKYSDFLIADSVGIQKYLQEKYNVVSAYIAYGANLFEEPETSVLEQYGVLPMEYSLLIARLEPENSIETILKGVCAASSHHFLVIGNHNTRYGAYIKAKFSKHQQVKFIGSVYNLNHLNNLRYYSNLYFHGHTVGGTNPSLLEAMASNALICAQDNIFNRSILGDDAYYFASSDAIATLMYQADAQFKKAAANQDKLWNNANKIRQNFAWPIIVDQYIAHFHSIKPNASSESLITTAVL